MCWVSGEWGGRRRFMRCYQVSSPLASDATPCCSAAPPSVQTDAAQPVHALRFPARDWARTLAPAHLHSSLPRCSAVHRRPHQDRKEAQASSCPLLSRPPTGTAPLPWFPPGPGPGPCPTDPSLARPRPRPGPYQRSEGLGLVAAEQVFPQRGQAAVPAARVSAVGGRDGSPAGDGCKGEQAMA